MKVSALARYDRFYTNPAYMGVKAILRSYLGLDADHPVPLSVAHGVDFGHAYYPQDVISAEPIHWSCNEEVHRAAQAYKPSILLPHPWMMVTREMDLGAGAGTLVVGPPPGPVNDERLYRLIEKSVGDDWAILIKVRGACEDSFRFWEERGVKPVTAGPSDDQFYPRLARLLGGYRRIVGPTFSSALIYAAAIGREIELACGFAHRTIERRDYEKEVNWASPRAREVVRAFARGDRGEVKRVADHILGGGLVFDTEAKVEELHALIRGLNHPFWRNSKVRFPPAAVRQRLATALGKPGLLNAGVSEYLARVARTHLAVMTVDEFDVWLNGKTPANFSLQPIVNGRKHGLPGQAAEGYEL